MTSPRKMHDVSKTSEKPGNVKQTNAGIHDSVAVLTVFKVLIFLIFENRKRHAERKATVNHSRLKRRLATQMLVGKHKRGGSLVQITVFR